MELNKSIIKIRVALQKANLKKSGKNDYSKFDYFELADFLPKINELMLQEEMNDRFYFTDNMVVLELMKGDEVNTYTIPYIMYDAPKGMQPIQHLGALCTYYKRYLYMNAFGITDGEIIDAMDNRPRITPKQMNMIQTYYKGDNLNKLLKSHELEKLDDMLSEDASKIIDYLIQKSNEKKEKANENHK